MQLMFLHDLTAMNTFFEPKSTRALCTFLQTKRTGQQPHNDFGEYVGATVKAKYKAKWVEGKVVSTHFQNHKRTWIVKFKDGYIKKNTNAHNSKTY